MPEEPLLKGKGAYSCPDYIKTRVDHRNYSTMKKNVIAILVLLAIYLGIIAWINLANNKSDQQPPSYKCSAGVGFVVSRNGYLVTAKHVVENACTNKDGKKRVALYFHDENKPAGFTIEKGFFVAEVVHEAKDDEIDIAFLKIVGGMRCDDFYSMMLEKLKNIRVCYEELEKFGVEEDVSNSLAVIREETFKNIEAELPNITDFDRYKDYNSKILDLIDQLTQNIEYNCSSGLNCKDLQRKMVAKLQQHYVGAAFSMTAIEILKDDKGKLVGLEDGYINLKENRENYGPVQICPLPIRINDHRQGKLVCIPGSVCTTSQSFVVSFVYFPRIAAGSYLESSSFYVYFDKPVHHGMSGSPVLNSNGEVIAMVNANIEESDSGKITYVYSYGFSSRSINDVCKNCDLLGDGAIDAVIEDNQSAGNGVKFSNFPEFSAEELKELRKSIVHILNFSIDDPKQNCPVK